jgi:hypothetical protein
MLVWPEPPRRVLTSITRGSGTQGTFFEARTSLLPQGNLEMRLRLRQLLFNTTYSQFNQTCRWRRRRSRDRYRGDKKRSSRLPSSYQPQYKVLEATCSRCVPDVGCNTALTSRNANAYEQGQLYEGWIALSTGYWFFNQVVKMLETKPRMWHSQLLNGSLKDSLSGG